MPKVIIVEVRPYSELINADKPKLLTISMVRMYVWGGEVTKQTMRKTKEA